MNQDYTVVKPFENYREGASVSMTDRQAQFLLLGGFLRKPIKKPVSEEKPVVSKSKSKGAAKDE